MVRHQLGDAKTAERNIRQAIEADKRNPAYHRSLGIVLRTGRRYDEAIKCFGDVIRLDPHSIDTHNDMGTAYFELSRTGDAIACYRRALEIDARYVPAHNNLGLALKDRGDIDGAVNSFRRAVELDPKSVLAHNNLGLMLQDRGEREAALAAFRAAIRLASEQTVSWIHFAEALRFARIDSADSELEEDILACFGQDGVNTQRLAVSAIGLLRLDAQFAELSRKVFSGDIDPEEILRPENVRTLNHRLLIAVLWHAVIPDIEIEMLLTSVRQALLQAALDDELPKGCDELVLALSAYCFTNEYVFAVTETEAAGVERLIARLDHAADVLDPGNRSSMALVGCYRPLHALLWSDRFTESDERGLNGKFGDLVRRQILEPCEEAELESEIVSLDPIIDSVSQKVREQYEENPYPRWRTVNAGRARPLASVVRQLFPHAPDLPEISAQRTDILIAGCGTGQTAIQASYRFTEPQILAVDLSRTSLAYARRRARELDIGSIEFVHGDILNLGDSGHEFDFIEAAGVLHHMADPLAGWKELRGLLRPGGFMKVALYSEHARRYVAAARKFVEVGGYAATPSGIRRCRQDIIALPEEDGARTVAGSLDFHAMSPCRDLIFHVQERSYVLPEIEEMLEVLGLRFVGFELRDRSLYATYRERFPDDGTLSNLANWQELETAYPDTFAGMYQFWVRADDR